MAVAARQPLLFFVPPSVVEPVKGRKLPKFLSEAEQERLEAVAEHSGPRDLALVLCTTRAGLRCSEVCALRWKHVEDGRVQVEQGKGGKDRVIPMHARLSGALEAVRFLLQNRTQIDREGYIFAGRGPGSHLTVSGAERIMARLGRAAGLPGEKRHPHAGRHGFAVSLLEAGNDVRRIQQLLGHSSLATTMVYLDLTAEHLRSAVDSLR